MSQTIAIEILARVGPGRILHYGCTSPELICALLTNGCDAYGISESRPDHPAGVLNGRIDCVVSNRDFDTLILDHGVAAKAADLQALFAAVRSLIGRNLVVLPADSSPSSDDSASLALSKAAIERAAIDAGYRRNPATYATADYEQYNLPLADRPMYFEIIPTPTLDIWPQDKLWAERDLHMDMTRETGPRSDAHMVRYSLAAEWIRPSDTVLDCACGLGYGTAMLAARSSGASFIGVDIDPASIDYANDNFPGYRIDFRVRSASRLDFLADHSVDVVVSFETLEHLEDYSCFLKEVARVLKPDGRIIVSVPNLWIDETGRDPNPHHHHVFDFEKCRAALAENFIVEARYAQTAPGGTKLKDAARMLVRLPLAADSKAPDAEWWIVVASANPMRGAAVAFSRAEYDRCTDGTTSKVTAFANCYDNPWLYRAWIQIGFRLSDEKTLAKLIAEALPSTATDSADRGGLLAVAAYSALRNGDIDSYGQLLQDIAEYIRNPAVNPHVYRWRISLEFVAALLALASGRRAEASRFLDAVTARDPMQFSPLIATKLLAAHFLAGTMHLVDRDEDAARKSYVDGIEVARRALHAPDGDAIGNPQHPLPFGFVELAEIADMASQCALAIDALPRFRRSPALFWRTVDARRFGMISWLGTLEARNRQLDAEIATLREEAHNLRSELELLRANCTVRSLLPARIRELGLVIIPRLIRGIFERRA